MVQPGWERAAREAGLRVVCLIFVDASAGTLSCRLLDVVERQLG